MVMKPKSGRPPHPPQRSGTLHIVGTWENRLWLYKESIKYGLSMSQIFDEMVETIRKKHRRYNPQRIADRYSWDYDEQDDIEDYERRKASVSDIVSKTEKKINELEERRSR